MTKPKTNRQLQAEQTKDKLFHAAESLLKEQDFDKITIRDITARAEVSVGTFYHYYATKLDVFYETYRLADEYFATVVSPLLTAPTAEENILLFFRHYAILNDEQTDRKLIYLLFNPANTYFNRESGEGMTTVLRGVVERGIASGEIVTGDDADYIVRYFMICARGLVYNWCTSDYSYDLKAETQRFTQRLLRAYIPKSGR